ncbi:MAG: undecaprenyl/decaprenyl-phosphate alpha-N-acetylglucosaminyl 1-phosphate transferase [Desulfamplus sp.]|nr:undecaprenyl/decaprenyl-phosphate alpha-N-acetylglucosaminyl 1-phosphate transferase [Desulfamplus sp.]MBF0413132.1 undecaprenyl/decaprenyl-phosphate alpha-N-acetylglucosaminyl 1-phosphate transferase [Desulfamplus sp.]
MPNFTLKNHLLLAFFLFLVSAAISLFLIKNTKVLDIPNGRSSHSKPTPTIGGVAIVFTFFLSMAILYFFANTTMITEKYFIGFTFSSLLIAGMSFYDDFKCKPFYIKLATQIIAVLVVMSFGIIIHQINFPYNFLWLNYKSLGAASYVITFGWILGMTNAYNFMDGLNGMAGGNAIIASIFFCIISFDQGSNFTYMVSYTLASGTLGFLIFNFPRGKLFMGDIGSTFLGFSFATLSIIASLYDDAHTSLLIIPLLFFHFIYDTFFTFMRRLLKGENVFHAHRTHLYQLFNRLGYTHFQVTMFYYTVALVQGFGALWMIKIEGLERLLVFIPYLIFQIVYSIVIIYHAKKRGIL